ncbi:MAG TPA: hypothetical protein VMV01_01780, partial [Planctomycetota bacterium]|nr:hypothetical protein [Planctomycetota bacterium]
MDVGGIAWQRSIKRWYLLCFASIARPHGPGAVAAPSRASIRTLSPLTRAGPAGHGTYMNALMSVRTLAGRRRRAT